jgi:hypothetical protein
MARTNLAVKQQLWKRFRARTGRQPNNDELLAMIDLCDAMRETCELMVARYAKIPPGPMMKLIEPQLAYYRHLTSGLVWIASCIVNIHESKTNVLGIGNSRRRSDKRSNPNSGSTNTG